MLTTNLPQSSSLLVSEPFMADPNFTRSVVLLTEHNEEGSVGFVLNQQSNLLLKDILAECGGSDLPVFIGGPVGNDTLHFIHNCYEKINSGTKIKEGIYWGGNFETLKILINSGEISNHEIKIFVGYSGWSPLQLEDELEQNSWIIANNYNSSVPFATDDENLWREVLIALGPKYAHVANFPQNPQWN